MAEPVFVTYLSALLTPTIAVAVAWISFQQWRTARTRLNLDIFDKRSQVYESALQALTWIARDGSAKKSNAFEPIYLAWREGQFLFGSEVTDHLDSLMTKIMEVTAIEFELDSPEKGSSELVQRKWDLLKQLASERLELVNWFRPYMLIDEQRVRLPSEWFREMNKRRLSYADEKQKN